LLLVGAAAAAAVAAAAASTANMPSIREMAGLATSPLGMTMKGPLLLLLPPLLLLLLPAQPTCPPLKRGGFTCYITPFSMTTKEPTAAAAAAAATDASAASTDHTPSLKDPSSHL
jgi:hypothetical protein